jgi:hypothetical protein
VKQLQRNALSSQYLIEAAIKSIVSQPDPRAYPLIMRGLEELENESMNTDAEREIYKRFRLFTAEIWEERT